MLSRQIEILREDLPEGILRDFADAVSVEAAIGLCVEHGSGKIYVPVGRKCPRELLPVQHIYGGALVTVPSIRRVTDRAQRRSILADHRAGARPKMLMRRYLISRRQLGKFLHTTVV